MESFDFDEAELETEERVWELYERWASHYKVQRSVEEKQKRYNVFKANAHRVNDFNKKDESYKKALNMFSDMTDYEFLSTYTGGFKMDPDDEMVKDQL